MQIEKPGFHTPLNIKETIDAIIFCDKCNNLMSGSHKKGKLICVACGFIKQLP